MRTAGAMTPLPPEDLNAVLVRARQGDVVAFERLFKATWDPVCHAVAHYAEEQPVVEDAVQEAYTKAYQNLKNFDSSSEFLAFIIDRARRGVQEQRRQQQRLSYRDDLATMLDPSPEHRLVSAEVAERVRRCLGELGPQARRLAWLRFAEGRTVNSIAEVLHRTVNSVSVSIYRLRKLLDECLRRGNR